MIQLDQSENSVGKRKSSSVSWSPDLDLSPNVFDSHVVVLNTIGAISEFFWCLSSFLAIFHPNFETSSKQPPNHHQHHHKHTTSSGVGGPLGLPTSEWMMGRADVLTPGLKARAKRGPQKLHKPHNNQSEGRWGSGGWKMIDYKQQSTREERGEWAKKQ